MGIRDKPPPQILSGWKDIARHLGMGVRTVQRYERQLGLPVRRPSGRPRGAVLATIAELDAWVAASPIREAFELSRMPPDSAASQLNEVKLRIKETHALHEQLVMLRNELATTVHTLHASVQSLQTDLQPGAWEPASLTMREHNSHLRNLRNWLSMAAKRKPN